MKIEARPWKKTNMNKYLVKVRKLDCKCFFPLYFFFCWVNFVRFCISRFVSCLLLCVWFVCVDVVSCVVVSLLLLFFHICFSSSFRWVTFDFEQMKWNWNLKQIFECIEYYWYDCFTIKILIQIPPTIAIYPTLNKHKHISKQQTTNNYCH
jgi:hypothetical protein